MKKLPKPHPRPNLGPRHKIGNLSEMNLPPEVISEIHEFGRQSNELCRLIWELRASGWTPDKTRTHVADYKTTDRWYDSEPRDLD